MMSQGTVNGARLARLLADRTGESGDRAGRLPAYARLAGAVERLVLDGRLPAGTRLPGERDLAAALGVSRTTATAAYRELREHGYALSRRGSGHRVVLPAVDGAGRAFTPSQDETVTDLACATLPAVPGFADAVAGASADLARWTGRHGYQPHGLPELREALAARYAERGLPTDPDQIVVTGGALAAFDLVLRHVVGPGDRVLVEHPTYPNALRCVATAGARAVPVAVDPDGWDVPAFEAALRQAGPRLAYLIPEFQNPTGLLMPGPVRARLAGALAAAGTTAVVDESLVELPLDLGEDELPPPFAAPARGRAPVVLIGGSSKPFWGGLSIGWLRAPADLVAGLLDTRSTFSLGTPVLDQLVLTRLLASRRELLGPRRDELRERRDGLLAALRRELPEWTPTTPAGGLSVWCAMPHPVATTVAALAARERVLIGAGPKFGVGGAFERHVRLPYTLPVEPLEAAVGVLARAYAIAVAGGARPVGALVA